MQDRVWQAVLGEIELSVSKASFATWFKNTVLLENTDEITAIGVPNIFAKQQLEVKYRDLINKVLNKNGIKPKQLVFQISSDVGGGQRAKTAAAPQLTIPAKTANKKRVAGNSSGLNSRYTFSEFIVGAGNELAHAACQAIVKAPGIKYNPLFVYGGVGLGKTHLIQAVGNALLSEQPDYKVVYISSETFVNEFLDSIRYKKKGFADKYRAVDVLIVDDIQFIAGKERTEEEFFHTFNALHQANKQIILSSDKPPRNIPTLTERLRSRFEWGMTVDIQPPDFETRCAILQTKSESRGIKLSQETTEYLATHVQTNIRELEGALNHLLAYCEMRQLTPDAETAAALLSNSHRRPKRLSPKVVIERTAKYFHISLDDIVGPKRDKDIVLPRQIAMYLLRTELHLSFPKVARELGRKDHTTAIHSIDKIERAMRQDPSTREHINSIKELLYA